MDTGCPACGAVVAAGTRRCPTCGGALAGAAGPVSMPERYHSPLAYTSPHLTERILRYRGAIEGEHKLVTVLFCDLVNSTEIAERLGPERMHDLLDRFFRAALDEIHRYEGTVNQFLGDGFMALFGAPLALEHHERGAVLATLAIRRRVREDLSEVGEPLAVRAGLNTGPVVVGKIGDNLRMDYTAVGDVTNVAARLQALAEPHAVLATEATCQRVRDIVITEPLGPVAIRGKRQPVVAHQIVGPRPSRAADADLDDRRHTPFVARERELAVLHDALAQALAERGRAVGLVGDPGIGKSRLVHELRQSLRGRRVTYLEGRCVSYGAGIPYLPVLDLLRANCGLADTDTPEEIAAKVGAAVQEVGLVREEWTPHLLHFLGLKEAGPQLDALGPEALKARTFEALLQLSLRGSEQRPLIMVVEDMHWIDRASEEFFDAMADSLSGASILFVATYRPGYTPAWISRSYATQLALSPISPPQSETLVRALAGASALSGPAVTTIVARAEGNPFFLEELARAFAERPDAPVGQAIPDTLHGLLMSRIDRLPDEAKRLLQLASVIGREFPVRLLAAVASEGGPPEASLREFERRELLYQRSRGEDTVCVFKHALTRDVVYASLLESRRRLDHAAVGAALERLYAGRTDEVAELLAHHFGLSDDEDRAVDYAIRAADKAQRRWANAEALAFWQSAQARLERMPDTEATRVRRLDATIRQAEVRFALGHHAEQIDLLERVRPLVESADPPHRAAWHYWLGFLHSLTGSAPEVAIAHCRQASAIAEQEGLEEIGAFADACLVQVYVFAGELDAAIAAGERALAVFEARRNLWWACRALAQLSSAANARGEWERSLGYCQQALAHALELDDLRLKVSALARMASTHVQQGDWQRGLGYCDEALALGPTPYDAAAVKAIRGYALTGSGRLDEGITLLEEALVWYEHSSLKFTRCQFTLWLAEALLARGDRVRGVELVQSVLSLARELRYRHLEASAERLRTRMAED